MRTHCQHCMRTHCQHCMRRHCPHCMRTHCQTLPTLHARSSDHACVWCVGVCVRQLQSALKPQLGTRERAGSSGGGREGDGEQNAPPCLSRCVVVMCERCLQQQSCLCVVVCWCVCTVTEMGPNRAIGNGCEWAALRAAPGVMAIRMRRRGRPGAPWSGVRCMSSGISKKK